MDLDRSEQLGQGSVPRLLLRFSAPAIVGMSAQALYSFIDRLFVSWSVGPKGIAGIAVSLPPMLIVLAFGMLIGFGAATLISIRLGQQRKAEAEQLLGHAVVLLSVAAIVMTVVGLLLLDPMLIEFGASPTILPYARDYLRIIVCGTLFQMLLFGLNAAIRGEGNPRIAMLTMLISVVLNLVLAPLFVLRWHWGMQGAALATVIAQIVSATWVVLYFLVGPSVLKFRARNLLPRWKTCGRICAAGSPVFAMAFANAVLQKVLNDQIQYYGNSQFHSHGGDMAMAVWGIIYPAFMLVAMPIFGLNQGAQPIIGYNYGAHRFDRVKRTLETGIVAATAWTACGFAVAMLFPDAVVRLFIPQKEHLLTILPLGTHAIRLTTLMLPLIGFQIVSASYFQAVGKPKQAMLLLLSRQALFLIPAALVLPHFLGLDGVWAALPTADAASSLLTGVCLFLELRHLRDRHADEMAAPTPVPVGRTS